MAKPKATASPATEPTTALPTDLITMTRADVAAMIADALQARQEDEAGNIDPSAPPPGMELAKAIGAAVAEQMAVNNPKKVTYGAYLKRPTLNHPLGVLSPKLSRVYFQNGMLITYDAVNDEQVLLLNRITHSGRYHDRKVEVIVRDAGGDGQSVEFRYKNASLDDRMELKSLFRNFTEFLKVIVEAQDAERAADEANPRRVVTRPFGSGKNTLAAEQAAGV